jgi:CDP-glucose 4,6-dehydratase
VRDYFYVEDGAASYTLLAQALAEDRTLAGEAFNFSNETQVTVLELAQKILAAMGSDLEPTILDEAPNEIRSQYLSAERARARLGWEPLFSLDAGLDRTIDWYRDFFERAAA